MYKAPVSVRRKRRWVWAWVVILAVGGLYWYGPDSGESTAPEGDVGLSAERMAQVPAGVDSGPESGPWPAGASDAKDSAAEPAGMSPDTDPRELPLTRDGDGLSAEALAAWPGARVVAVGETAVLADGRFRRVGILQPTDLPYRVRVEELVRRADDDGERVEARVEMVADRLLVRPAVEDGADRLEEILAGLPVVRDQALTRSGWLRVAVESQDPDAVPALIAALEAGGGGMAEPDYIVRTFAEPNDPRYLDGSLWGMRNTGRPGADVSAEAGWAIRHDASEVIVGIVDSGLRLTHEDIVANLWVNPNETADGEDSDGNGFVDDLHGIDAVNRTGDPTDESSHGTHVAGTVGAVGNNGVGVTGIAWNVRLMGLRFIGTSGGGSISDAIVCIEYAVDHGAHILNNSWGGTNFSQALYDTVDLAREAGVIFVAAAGNASSNNDVSQIFPASLPLDNIVTVASTDRRDDLSSFSNFGEGSVDIGAPGTDILSLGIASDSQYTTKSGTSMASPLVAGALALLRAEFPEDHWGQLINRLYRGVDRIPALDEGVVATGGRLNLAGALTAEPTPLNNRFADARHVFGDVVLLRGANHGATAHAEDPVFGGGGPPNAVWYRYTAQAGGQAAIRILPSREQWNPMTGATATISHNNIPALLAVFTVDEDGNPVLLEEAQGSDLIDIPVSSGDEFFVGVAGQDGADGLFMLDIAGPPRNGELINARALDLSRTVSGTNRNARPEFGEPAHAGQAATATVWYKWTASVSGRLVFTTRGSDIRTLAAVYAGPAETPTFDQLRPEGANISATRNLPARVVFDAVAGQTYYMAVDGVNGAEGAVAATIGMPPANDDFANSTVLQGTAIERTVSTNFASSEEGEPAHFPGRGNGESVWFTWTAPENGRTAIIVGSTFAPAIVAVYTGDRIDALSLVSRDFSENQRSQVVFEATAGTIYRIAVDSTGFSLINAPFSLNMLPVPPNETFANATTLEGLRTTIIGTNAGARREPGEPNNNYNSGPSVWYRWTAPVSGEVGLYGERLDKPILRSIVLNIFTGDAVNNLTHVREDLGNGIGRDAFARWQAVAGRTYHIQVTSLDRSGIAGGPGPFRLDLRPIAEHVAPNATFGNAIELDGSTVYNFRTHNYGLSPEPGEPRHGGVSPQESLWWRFTAPASGRYAVGTGQSEGALITAVYRTTDPANPSFASLEPVAHNHGSAAMAFPDVAWNAQADETYYIALERVAGGRGRVIFHFHRVPDNIVHMRAATLTGDTATVITHNWGAVREPGEPTLGANASRLGSRSLWWQWTAPATGRYIVDTFGSRTPVAEDGIPYPDRTEYGFATRLGVFTGSSLSNLNQVAVATRTVPGSYGNSWLSEAAWSRVEFHATEGTTYKFLVNGINIDRTENEEQTNTGRIQLNLAPATPPPNATFVGATVITELPHQTLQSTLGATKEPGEPAHGGIHGGRSLWWKWTATESGPMVASTAGALYDDFHARRTGLGVYTGDRVSGLVTVASDQNGAGLNTGDNTWSLATFEAVAGTTYYFGVDAQFPGNLSFILTRPPENDRFADATEMRGSRWTALGHNLGANREPGEPRVDGGYISEPDNNFRSVWWRWTAPASGEISLDTLGSESVNVIAVFTGNAVDALTPVTPVPTSSGNPFNGSAERRARSGNNSGRPTTFMAVAGTTYHITVQGAGFFVTSAGPLRLTLEGPPAIPFAPENVFAARIHANRVDLVWDDVAVDEEAYAIERAVDGGPWILLDERPPGSKRFTDLTVEAHRSYAYRVQAVNRVGASEWVEAIPESILSAWRREQFGTTANTGSAADTAMPFGDGVPNLLKYAFNMDARGFDDRFLTAGSGTAGLPAIHPTAPAEAGVLVIEYVRRRAETDPGIEYIVEFSGDPAFAHTVSGSVERVQVLDGSWERVRVRDTEAPDRRFARVRMRRTDSL